MARAPAASLLRTPHLGAVPFDVVEHLPLIADAELIRDRAGEDDRDIIGLGLRIGAGDVVDGAVLILDHYASGEHARIGTTGYRDLLAFPGGGACERAGEQGGLQR